jgi:hypothetical protein
VNLADQIKATLIAALPEGSNLEEKDINLMTNMVLTTLKRNRFITEEEHSELQIPNTDKSILLDLYGELWKLLLPENLIENVPLDTSNRENGE